MTAAQVATAIATPVTDAGLIGLAAGRSLDREGAEKLQAKIEQDRLALLAFYFEQPEMHELLTIMTGTQVNTAIASLRTEFTELLRRRDEKIAALEAELARPRMFKLNMQGTWTDWIRKFAWGKALLGAIIGGVVGIIIAYFLVPSQLTGVVSSTGQVILFGEPYDVLWFEMIIVGLSLLIGGWAGGWIGKRKQVEHPYSINDVIVEAVPAGDEI